MGAEGGVANAPPLWGSDLVVGGMVQMDTMLCRRGVPTMGFHPQRLSNVPHFLKDVVSALFPYPRMKFLV